MRFKIHPLILVLARRRVKFQLHVYAYIKFLKAWDELMEMVDGSTD